jgi:hypothetical protein
VTDIEKEQFEQRLRVAENRSMVADTRSQLALNVAIALRDVLAIRSPQFDAEFVAQLASMPVLSVPTIQQIETPAKLMELLKSFETTLKNLKQNVRDSERANNESL